MARSDPTSGCSPVSDAYEGGGTAAHLLLTPGSYRTPVRGKLRHDTIHREVLATAEHFNHLKTVVTNVVGQVWRLMP